MKVETYKSRISPLIWGIGGGIFLFAFLKAGSAAYQDPKPAGIALLAGIFIPAFILLIYVMTGIRYVVDDQYLTVKIGRFTSQKILVSKIESLRRSYNPLSSPANSIKRLRVSYGSGMVLISPAKEADFINYLVSLNPDIKIHRNLK